MQSDLIKLTKGDDFLTNFFTKNISKILICLQVKQKTTTFFITLKGIIEVRYHKCPFTFRLKAEFYFSFTETINLNNTYFTILIHQQIIHIYTKKAKTKQRMLKFTEK